MVFSKSNDVTFSLFILLFLLNFISSSIASQDLKDETQPVVQDYCSAETFQPRCSTGEVILMKSAICGRMRIGRCITKEEVEELSSGSKSIGCSTDVLDLMDQKCTGKAECNIRIFDISLELPTRPCFPAFLSLYMETSYECIKIADDKRTCTVDVTSSTVHVFDWKSCGTMSQPWNIVAPIGQRIIVSKIIVKHAFSEDGKVSRKCSNQVTIVDKVAKINTSECTTGSEREEQIYSSTGNMVDVFLKSSDRKISIESEGLILKFQAVGCSDIIPPTDAYFKRHGEEIIVGCYASRKSWHLYCENGKWIGVIGNCSQGSWTDMIDSSPDVQVKVESFSSEQVLWIVVIVGFSASICLAAVCFGAVFLKRLRFKSEQNRDYKTLKHQINPFSNQLTLTQTENGTVFMPVVNDTQCTPSGQPTYSVFVGDDVFNEVNQQTIASK